ncbi:MAG: orotidine-5'-phosphate decarboxylase [Planctomycetota bacterium]|nr:MAG: orotidine-5'-phosphate decarboxylase [Planctomycetota bacterium]
MESFADKLINSCRIKKSLVLVGIDPRKEQVPDEIKKISEKHGWGEAYLQFGKAIIDSVKNHAVAIKPQVAFFEEIGPEGFTALQGVLSYATEKGLLTISDCKRGDIGSTAKAYAAAYLSDDAPFLSDAVTVNGYLGEDGLIPFFEHCTNGKGVFVLVKTSNKGSQDFQDQSLLSGHKLFEEVARKVALWGKSFVGKEGFSSIGAVVGATWPQEAKELRELMPSTLFLIPGYGAQGGSSADSLASMNKDGLGGIINSSRGIIFAYENEKYKHLKDWRESIENACSDMKKDIQL